MTQMMTVLGRLDSQRALALFGDWTDRIAAGELPFDQPARPQGVERNIVLTLWDWSTPTGYMHDVISTDRHKPTVNANGKLYGATNTPHMYVVDKAGTLVYAGAIDDRPTSRRADVQGANNYVRAALDAVAAGQPVKTPITRAYGCTVKYS